ncbi:MAG: cytochrome c4 [Nitrosomonadales bacterium]|nr:MAG: cytochrome c4 [Nitrosomonadales bacterium]
MKLQRDMMMKYPVYWAVVMIALVTMTTSVRAEEENHGQKLIHKVCSACHGQGGTTTSPNFPRLAGQQAVYMEKELTEFRDKSRKDPDAAPMWGWARSLSDQDIKEIAAYYAAQTPVPGENGAENLLARGKEIFETGIPSNNVPACASCHGPNAEGNGGTPRLASQHAAYLTRQLGTAFHDATLRPEAVAMHFVVKGLSDEDIKALTTYLQSK